MKNKRIIIVGAGIMGAALAAELTAQGAEIILMHEWDIRSDKTATARSWAWIHAGEEKNYAYFRLRRESMRLWRSIAQNNTDILIRQAGSLAWDIDRQEAYARIRRYTDWQYPVILLDREQIAQRVPMLKNPPEYALLSEKDMYVDPVSAVLSWIRCVGIAPVQTHVKALETRNGHVIGVRCDEGLIQADDVILAAGYGIAPLLQSVDIDLHTDRPTGLILYSHPMKPYLDHMLITPTVLIRQDQSGRLIIVGAETGEKAEKKDYPHRLLSTVADLIAFPEEIRTQRHCIAERVIPKDGLPLIGRYSHIEGLYVTLTHSGITNAPAIAKYVTQEVLYGKRSPFIEPFGVERTA